MSIVQRIEALEERNRSLEQRCDHLEEVNQDLMQVISSLHEVNASFSEAFNAQNRVNSAHQASATTQNDLLKTNTLNSAFDTLILAALLKILHEDKVIARDTVQAMINSAAEVMDPTATSFYGMFKTLAEEPLQKR